VDHGTARRCRFSTDRLDVAEWHDTSARTGADLVEVVGRVLTASTTAALPPEWQGDFDRARSERWIASRDAESPTLLVVDRASGEAVGLLILFEEGDDATGIDVRLGYVIAEASWGRGVATELVGGLVAWAASQPACRSITGGVAPGNVASARVLAKNGFVRVDGGSGDDQYRRDLR
jgi:RimJ/RimL family protein N-acetyltransferase